MGKRIFDLEAWDGSDQGVYLAGDQFGFPEAVKVQINPLIQLVVASTPIKAGLNIAQWLIGPQDGATGVNAVSSVALSIFAFTAFCLDPVAGDWTVSLTNGVFNGAPSLLDLIGSGAEAQKNIGSWPAALAVGSAGEGIGITIVCTGIPAFYVGATLGW